MTLKRKQLREIFQSLNLNLASSGGDMRPVRQAFARGMFMNCAEERLETNITFFLSNQ